MTLDFAQSFSVKDIFSTFFVCSSHSEDVLLHRFMGKHKYYILLLWLLLALSAMGQEVKTSLMIAEPTHQQVQSSFGHAFLRLQYPAAALDYCFSMESGDYEGFLDICTGHYPNRLVAVPTAEYLQSYDHEGRTVTEYMLNLNQGEAKRLWKFLDNTSAQGVSPYHDYFHHGCSQEILHYLTLNLDGDLVYGEAAKQYGNTIFLIGNQTLPANSWVHLTSLLFSTDGTDRQLTDAEKTLIPHIIPTLLSDAVIKGLDGTCRPILRDEVPVIYPPSQHFAPNTAPPVYVWFLLALGLVLLISLLDVCCSVAPVRALGRFLDVSLFILYQVIVLGMLIISILSTLPTTSGWNWNYLIYNPLPLVIWLYDLWRPLSARRRANLYIYYALWLTAFMVAMFVIGDHFLIEQYLLALMFNVRCLFKAYKYRHSISNV